MTAYSYDQDDLPRAVNAERRAGAAAQRAQVLHGPVPEEKRVQIPRRSPRLADDVPGRVEAGAPTRLPAQRPEIPQLAALEAQEHGSRPAVARRAVRWTRDRTAGRAAHGVTAQQPGESQSGRHGRYDRSGGRMRRGRSVYRN